MSATTDPIRDGQYYLDDKHLIFLIENTLFRVHSHFLVTHSPIFADMLSCPTSEGAEPEGGSDSNPIVLDGVKAVDFQRLLWVFYNEQVDVYAAPKETWFSVLALAHKWEMTKIGNLAIKKLGSLALDPVEKIRTCLRYDIDRSWALGALVTLCTRDDAIILEEGSQLGLQTCLQIAKAREEISKLKIKASRVPVSQEVSRPQNASGVVPTFGAPSSALGAVPVSPEVMNAYFTALRNIAAPSLRPDSARTVPTEEEITKVVKEVFEIK